ncbi:MAG TPA: shikimate dehydrogenase [Bacillales bacterium]|nr:shikimate dehydrogenase [Bacillales bacterium]
MGKLFALIGHPVGHSLSAIMHNEEFQALGLPHRYECFDVDPANLGKAIDGIRALGIAGFNVTVPHKVKVMQYLDEIDEEARQIGAVNTVVNQSGYLIGMNTDGKGFLHSLRDVTGEALSSSRVLMVGAGGAARGVAVTLDRYGVKQLDIANRTLEKAESLIEDGIRKSMAQVITLEEAESGLPEYDVIINTTPVGMSPNTDELPMGLNGVKPGTVLADLIYNPLQTKWLKIGEGLGATTMNGIGMFVGQGALAFEKWTGQNPDRERMRQTVLRRLEGR